LAKDVEPITNWTDLPLFQRPSDVVANFASDSMIIEEFAGDLLQDILPRVQAYPPQLYLIAVAIKTEQKPGELPRLHFIQLRTSHKIYVFKVRQLLAQRPDSFSKISFLGHCSDISQ